jgi:hypothetical protein
VARTHKLIMAKLEKYPSDVQELAIRVLELAKSTLNHQYSNNSKALCGISQGSRGAQNDSPEDAALQLQTIPRTTRN